MRIFICVGRVICVVSALLMGATVASAQPGRSNVTTENRKGGNAGENPAPAAEDLFPFRPIDTWVGKRFIFLSGPKASDDSTYEDFPGKLTHKQYQGRTATVVSAEDFGGRFHVVFEMEDTKERLRAYAPPQRGTVRGLALIEDIENARAQWVGSTLRCKQKMIFSYDEQKDVVGPILIGEYSPLKVIDVVPGWDEERPVRFWVQTSDGKRGFLDLNLSGTNVFAQMRSQHGFDHYFKIEAPRKARK